MKAPKSTLPPDFYQRVFELVRTIPRGRVTTYGHIARTLGLKSSARLVGYALTLSNQMGFDVPAHRVVNRQGLLTGKMHFGGPEVMADLLRAEGIEIENDQVQDFKRLLWDPASP